MGVESDNDRLCTESDGMLAHLLDDGTVPTVDAVVRSDSDDRTPTRPRPGCDVGEHLHSGKASTRNLGAPSSSGEGDHNGGLGLIGTERLVDR